MVFSCQQCGECCSHLGLVYAIIGSGPSDTFRLINNYTNVVYEVQLDRDKKELFVDQSIFSTRPQACPFFRIKKDTGLAYCTIHATRPDICREYSCYRLRIENRRGERVGRIIYSRTLLSEDPFLVSLWEKHVSSLKEPDDTIWEHQMIRILTTAGFLVI